MSCRGSAVVEFALVIPIFLTLIFAPLYLGRIFLHYEVAQKVARDAARYVSSASLRDMKNPNKVANTIEVARAIAKEELEGLRPGEYAPVVTVLCDGSTCDGFAVPVNVSVIVRLYMQPDFASLIDMPDMVLTAKANFRYMGE